MLAGTFRTLILAALAISLLPLQAAAAPSGGGPGDPWQDFLDDRESFLTTLAPPFVECFARRDSAIDPGSPIFHGCLDWHSAAHAAYSHHVVTRRTGDQTYLDLANAQIEPGGVSLVGAELAYEQAKGLDLPLVENPYGFGWFLILAKEREELTGRTDMRAMADYAAAEMVRWFQTRESANDARTFILDERHSNYSFSLLNLDVWARYTGDPVLLGAVRDAAAPLFAANLDTSCPVARDATNRSGFQPACMMRLAAVAHIYGDHVRDWVIERIPADFTVPPITSPASCHAGGLNFTRAFALYQLYRVTGEEAYRENYADLIRFHVGRPDLYIDPSYAGDPGYLCYSHWVAQVGVRAISLSYEDPPATPAFPPTAAATAVSVTSAEVEGDAVEVAGTAAFADQSPVLLGTDPSGDVTLPVDLGQDLLSSSAWTTPDGQLRLRAIVEPFASNRLRGPRIAYTWKLCRWGASCYAIIAWSTQIGAVGWGVLGTEVEVRRCTGSCFPQEQQDTEIVGTARYDLTGSELTVSVPLEAMRWDAPAPVLFPVPEVLTSSTVGRGGSAETIADTLSSSASFGLSAREVSLAVGAPGQDPSAVAYTAEAEVGADGAFAGEIDVAGLAGQKTLYVRACFADACGYATRSI